MYASNLTQRSKQSWETLHYCSYYTSILQKTEGVTNEICRCIMQTLRRMTSSWDISKVWFWGVCFYMKRRVTPSFWTYLSSMFSGLLNAFLTFRTKTYRMHDSRRCTNYRFSSIRLVIKTLHDVIGQRLTNKAYNMRFDPAALLRMAGNGMLHCNTFTSARWVTGFFLMVAMATSQMV